MNLKQSLILAYGMTLVSAGAIATVQFPKHSVPTLAAAAHHEESLHHATVTALIDEIAQIEVERLLEGVKFQQEHPALTTLQKQQAQLEKRLAQLQPGGKKLIETAIARTIEGQIADLEVQYAKDQANFTEDHPAIQLQTSQIQALQQRLRALP